MTEKGGNKGMDSGSIHKKKLRDFFIGFFISIALSGATVLLSKITLVFFIAAGLLAVVGLVIYFVRRNRRYVGVGLSTLFLALLIVFGACIDPSAIRGCETKKSPVLQHITPTRFTVSSKGVITDWQTHLQWYIGPGHYVSWYVAKSWVENLTVDEGRWRMPMPQELQTLCREESSNNMNPEYRSPSFYVWSGEEYDYVWSGEEHDSSSAWDVCLSDGSKYWRARSLATSRAFAVRSQ